MIFIETKEQSQFHVVVGGNFGRPFQCPNCAKSLTLVATLPTELSSILLSESVKHPIHLFCCWRCNLMLDYLVYSFGAPEYEILKFNPGDAEGAFHSESYPEEFPELLINIRNPNPLESGKIANLYRLSAVGSAQYSMRCQEFEEHENLSIFVDDFFPLPYGEKFSSCPQCGYNKPVIACVPGTFDTIDITGNRFVFMVYIVCRECLKISCTHIVD